MTYEHEHKTIFELMGQSPHKWLSSASQLKRAADLVAAELRKILSVYPGGQASYHDLVLFNSYMLLAGLSIENLTKGILIGRHPEAINSDRFDLKAMVSSQGGHDLVHLAKSVNIPYDATELSLLTRLAKFVVWAGRYPIHLKAKESVSPSFATSDLDGIDKLFDRLVSLLEKKNPDPTVHFG
jgi:hypothetical protein